MKRYKLSVSAILSITLVGLAGWLAVAQSAETSKPAAPAEMKLPPGWTAEDMQACIVAGTPGKMHEYLAKDAGVWLGECTMWMAPGADPIKTPSKSTISPIMDGRYVKIEVAGEMPGMGPHVGLGICGFDNISQKFVATWIDNQSTGIMNGTGELTADGKILKWTYTGNCPLTKKPIEVRQIDTVTGADTKRLEMFGPDPKSGKEFKMISIELKKKK